METTISKYDNYLYERKFFSSRLTKHEIESLIKIHPAIFSEIYHPRYVNNIYLDSFNMKSYIESVNGLDYRLKSRIRWYGDLFGKIKEPVLELKFKNGFLIKKESYPLKTFSLDKNFRFQTILDVFSKSDIPEKLRFNLKFMNPTLLNRYLRKYFLSAYSDYRITLDSELQYFHIDRNRNTFIYKFQNYNNVIMELKYAAEMDKSAESITNFFPFTITRNSKYINGVEKLNLW